MAHFRIPCLFHPLYPQLKAGKMLFAERALWLFEINH